MVAFVKQTNNLPDFLSSISPYEQFRDISWWTKDIKRLQLDTRTKDYEYFFNKYIKLYAIQRIIERAKTGHTITMIFECSHNSYIYIDDSQDIQLVDPYKDSKNSNSDDYIKLIYQYYPIHTIFNSRIFRRLMLNYFTTELSLHYKIFTRDTKNIILVSTKRFYGN
jgi:hypothetical protein